MKVTLTVIKGPALGRVLEFHGPRGLIIGRAADADFRLPDDDQYVSRRHVFLEICPPACRVHNLGTQGPSSTNPPRVNERTVTEEAELKDGDILELGYTQFKISIETDLKPKNI